MNNDSSLLGNGMGKEALGRQKVLEKVLRRSGPQTSLQKSAGKEGWWRGPGDGRIVSGEVNKGECLCEMLQISPSLIIIALI
jgi:hypothetical protein